MTCTLQEPGTKSFWLTLPTDKCKFSLCPLLMHVPINLAITLSQNHVVWHFFLFHRTFLKSCPCSLQPQLHRDPVTGTCQRVTLAVLDLAWQAQLYRISWSFCSEVYQCLGPSSAIRCIPQVTVLLKVPFLQTVHFSWTSKHWFPTRCPRHRPRHNTAIDRCHALHTTNSCMVPAARLAAGNCAFLLPPKTISYWYMPPYLTHKR